MTVSFEGVYLPEIIKFNGEVVRPFGDKPLNNIILDTFFRTILFGNYQQGIQAYMQSCKAGDSSTTPQRTDLDILGNQVDVTHASTVFLLTAESLNNRIVMTRDFLFNPATAVTTYREACIGCYGINNITEIVLSRFVFPTDIVISPGDRLRINYSLFINLGAVFQQSLIPVLSSPVYNLDFSGYITTQSDNVSLLGAGTTYSIGGGTATLSYINNIQKGSFSSSTYFTRDFRLNNTATTSTTVNSLNRYSTPFNTLTGAANSLGFYTSAQAPSVFPNTYSVLKPITGPLGQVTLSNLEQTDQYSSIDATYFFPPTTTSREVSGVYLWRHSSLTLSGYVSYFNFNSIQTIPANIPISFKLKWYFTR